MPLGRLNERLREDLEALQQSGRAKGREPVIVAVKQPENGWGPRYFLKGYGDRQFIRMNANSYLGLSLNPELTEAEAAAAGEFGVGPGAVRFISGTYEAHVELERKLACFHSREEGMVFSSAYVATLGVIYPLTTEGTLLVSDELNHNCIIQAMRLGRPKGKAIYKHNDMADLGRKLQENAGRADRVLVVTDGVFSMRGDHAPLDELVRICEENAGGFKEGVVSIVDDSHGVGAFGDTGRGTEEYTGTKVDVLIGTLGKAFGVNGGYVVSSSEVITCLRETAPTYVYSNPITVSECRAAMKALDMVEGKEGAARLRRLRSLTRRFQEGLKCLGFETIEGEHPVVPLMVRDTKKTSELAGFLTEEGILATGLNFPVVPRGDEEIRFQVSAEHTESDIDYVLSVLERYKKDGG